MASEQVTRCPHCRTVFKVRPEQLAQAQGWLRCGQCRQVFDSSGLVLAWADDAPSEERLDIKEFLQAKDNGLPEPVGEAAGVSEALLSFEQALATFPAPTVPAPDALTQAVHVSSAAQPESAPDAFAQRGLLRWIGWVLVLVLLIQTGWALRPWWQTSMEAGRLVQQACARLSCPVPAVRDADRLLIDGSRLVRTDEGYRVEWTLRNRSSWPQHMPALELTLMAEGGDVLVRRVVQPAEMAAPDRLGSEQSWEAALSLQMPAETPVSGYRLLAFYP